jgi:Fe-S cluster assembly iron-binding protein IscA
MLTITPEAATAVGRWRRKLGAPARSGLRLFADGDRWTFAFVRSGRNGDEVVEESGVTAYLAPEVAGAVDGATLDATRNEDLVLHPPKPKRAPRRH